MNTSLLSSREWLETDGLGGFASGTATGIRTRRYQALLLTATTPPTGRMVLVNGFDASIETSAGTFSISSQNYLPDVIGGDGAQRIESFEWQPWPRWIFKLEDGTRVAFELFVVKGEPMTCLSWRVLESSGPVILRVRPFLSGRDYHGLHKCNGSFRFDAETSPGVVTWQPYDGVAGVVALHDGAYEHQPAWYYNFRYEEEQVRGLDFSEDLAAPGMFSWDLSSGEAALILTPREHTGAKSLNERSAAELLREARSAERRRRAQFPSALHKAADDYIVNRGLGKTIVAGYPWFTDWGRDTFIALRGLCLAGGRHEVARDILLAWAGEVSEGMLPNRFPDGGEQPEFNSVDASLWFVIAAVESMDRAKGAADERRILRRAIDTILGGYQKGTRFGIRATEDGLLACGVPGAQLTWMDSKIGDWVVTPRMGKPVEIQALWLNALYLASRFSARWTEIFERGLASFRTKFWNESMGALYDVVDCDHESGRVDATIRPNQILALGGLPLSLIKGEHARRVLRIVEDQLWTPYGLRSLAPGATGYTPRYFGGARDRDAAYHQGTVWLWLIGPFVEAWVRVDGGSDAVKKSARERFLTPLLEHLNEAGLGHVSEIADAEKPHVPRGCPFQAWSLGELLRLDCEVLALTKPKARSRKTFSPFKQELIPA
jgi:predicted glycogen debranching enzyme